MEKLSFGLIFFLCSLTLWSQDTLCIYKTKGVAILEHDKTKVPIKKGAYILKQDIVKIPAKSEIIAIDNNGSAYQINKEGSYSLRQLHSFKIKQTSSTLTSNYLKYIWKELTNTKDQEVLIAGVFRGDLLMLSPKDSSQIAGSRITLKWRPIEGEDLYSVFIRNSVTEDVLKIETNGSQLALFDDNPFFNEDDGFQWTVSTDPFPNLDNLPFYSFNLVDRNTYYERLKDYSQLIVDLKALGNSDEEINAILCETYGLCK